MTTQSWYGVKVGKIGALTKPKPASLPWLFLLHWLQDWSLFWCLCVSGPHPRIDVDLVHGSLIWSGWKTRGNTIWRVCLYKSGLWAAKLADCCYKPSFMQLAFFKIATKDGNFGGLAENWSRTYYKETQTNHSSHFGHLLILGTKDEEGAG